MSRSELERRILALSPERQDVLRRLVAARRRSGTRPVSLSQHGMWFFDQLVGASPLYTVAWRAEIAGPVDPARLTEAVRSIVNRHEALRSRFAVVDGEPAQIVADTLEVPVTFDDLSDQDAESVAVTVEQLVDDDTRIGMDLRNGPLLKVRLIRTASSRHILLLCVHHIVFDIVSTEVFFRDLQTSYDLALTGGERAEPAVPYEAFTAWQSERLDAGRLEQLVNYWKGALDGAPGLLDLPIDRPRPAVQTFRGAAYRFTIGRRATEAMCEAAAKQRCTPFMAFMAAFHLLMGRMSGQDDVCVATPVANRPPGFEDLIGLCLNMVIIRNDLAGCATYRDLLDRIRNTCLDAYEHSELPFDQLVQSLAPDRSLSHNPLVQVNCGLDRAVATSTRLGEAIVTDVIGLHLGWAKWDLSFGAVLHDDRIEVTVDYSTDLFDRTTIAAMADTFGSLLEQVCVNPDAPLADLTVSRPPRPDRAAAPRPRDPLAELRTRAIESPNAIAVEAGGTRLTRRDLDAASAHLAAGLRRAGAGHENTVLVVDSGDHRTVVAALGVLRSGAGLVYAPPDEAASRLTAARARYLVADPEIAEAVSRSQRMPIAVHPYPPDDAEAMSAPDREDPGEQVAAVVRTAGSTGTPRAVVVSWRALAEAVERRRGRRHHSAEDTVVLPGRLDSVWILVDLLAALSVGTTVHVSAGTVPALRGRASEEAYGLTETAGAFAYATDGRYADGSGAVYILDDRLRPVPLGGYGHVHLAGTGLARCYSADPRGTAETWLPDPWSGRPGARMLRTGDVGRLKPGGGWEFLVRADELTDPRVDPAVLERLLLEHPAVADVAVVTGGGRGVQVHLVAAPRQDEPLTLRDVQSFLGERLAPHLLPTAVVAHAALPRTPDGRTDRAALHLAERHLGPWSSVPYVAPRDDLEKVVTTVLAGLLEATRIGVDDNIFDLGAHSILAVRLLAQISEIFDAELSLRTVFEAPTAAELAVRISEAIGAEQARETAADAAALLALGAGQETR